MTAEEERAMIVAWLRDMAAGKPTPFGLDPDAALGLALDYAAALIERGDHLTNTEGK